MLSRIINWLMPARVDTPEALTCLIETEAARLSQRATTGFCHAKAGSNAELLFREAPFLEALEKSRWNAFALVLADLFLVAEGYLRPESQIERERLWAWLQESFMRIAAAQQTSYDFTEDFSNFVGRLGHARLAPPKSATEQISATCRVVYDSLPIHEKLRGDDYEVIAGLLSFGATGFRESLEKRCDPAKVLRGL